MRKYSPAYAPVEQILQFEQFTRETDHRKVVFGYHAECDPGDVPDYTTVLTRVGIFSRVTCSGAHGSCCDREL